MFPKKVYYGLRFILALAILPDGKLRGVAEIAESENLPLKFLEAIAVALRKSGVVDVKRGAGGGYYLARPIDRITLYDLVLVLDEKLDKSLEGGGGKAHKAVGQFFGDFKVDYQKLLKSYTLDKLKDYYPDEAENLMYYI